MCAHVGARFQSAAHPRRAAVGRQRQWGGTTTATEPFGHEQGVSPAALDHRRPATEMRDKVRLLVEDAQALLRPEDDVDLLALARTFTLRTSDGIAETFGPELIRRVRDDAPGVRLRFVRKLDKNSQGLRDGTTDLETGVVDEAIGPEIRSRALFTDRFVGAVRSDHPLARSAIKRPRAQRGEQVV